MSAAVAEPQAHTSLATREGWVVGRETVASVLASALTADNVVQACAPNHYCTGWSPECPLMGVSGHGLQPWTDHPHDLPVTLITRLATVEARLW